MTADIKNSCIPVDTCTYRRTWKIRWRSAGKRGTQEAATKIKSSESRDCDFKHRHGGYTRHPSPTLGTRTDRDISAENRYD